MIGKIHKGAEFGRLVAYLYDERPGTRTERHENPRMIAGTVVARDEPRAIAGELRAAAGLNPKVAKPAAHVALAVDPKEASQLDDERWGRVAEDYAQRMGFGQSAWVAVRHGDNHVHFVASRVDREGKVVSSHNDHHRNKQVCRDLEADHRLQPTEPKGKALATVSLAEREMAARRGEDPPRAKARQALEMARDGGDGTPEDFRQRAERGGVLIAPMGDERGEDGLAAEQDLDAEDSGNQEPAAEPQPPSRQDTAALAAEQRAERAAAWEARADEMLRSAVAWERRAGELSTEARARWLKMSAREAFSQRGDPRGYRRAARERARQASRRARQARAQARHARERARQAREQRVRAELRARQARERAQARRQRGGYAVSRRGWVDKDGEQVWVRAGSVHRSLAGPELESTLAQRRERSHEQGLER